MSDRCCLLLGVAAAYMIDGFRSASSHAFVFARLHNMCVFERRGRRSAMYRGGWQTYAVAVCL